MLTIQTLKRALIVIVAASVVACGSPQPMESGRAPVAIPKRPEPTPATADQKLDVDALEAIIRTATEQGPVAAGALRNQLLLRGIDATTLSLIDSELAWIEGDTALAQSLLDAVQLRSPSDRDRVYRIQASRAAIAGRYSDAAKWTYKRLQESLSASPLETQGTLFAQLMHLSDSQLRSQGFTTSDTQWLDWIELVRAYRAGRPALQRWLDDHPDHPAVKQLPGALDVWLRQQPYQQVAVLLPLSGPLQDAGESILQGVVQTLYQRYTTADQRPGLITIDTEEYATIGEAYQTAVDAGAEAVLGPLTKNAIVELAKARQLPVPILALNRPELLTTAPNQPLTTMALAPEDEAIQIAETAFGRGLRRALIIRPETDWGRRMESALRQRWQSLGGRSVAVGAISGDIPASQAIGDTIGSERSADRIKAVEDAFLAPVTSTVRKRQDFDVIFMLAPSPEIAREWRPLLVYHYAGDTPTFAPSSIYSGKHSIQDRDLNRVQSIEIPAVLNAVTVNRFTRLKALGADAVGMLDHLSQSRQTDAPLFQGETGLLSAAQSGEIRRSLQPIRFESDKLVPVQVIR